MRSRLLNGAVVMLVLAAFLLRLPDDAFAASAVPVTAPTSFAGMLPLPEISGETVIRQRLVRGLPSGTVDPEEADAVLEDVGEPIQFVTSGSWFSSGAAERLLGARLCTELLFGTYARTNTGTLRVTLVTQEGAFSEIVDVATLNDTQFNTVCFSAAPSAGAITLNSDSQLIVEPLSVAPGSSVTLWAAPDLRNGRILEPAGAGDTSIVMYFSVRSDVDGRARALLWLFTLLSVSMAAVAVFGSFGGGTPSRSTGVEDVSRE